MVLSAKTLVEQGIVITNGKGSPAQVGYDLTVKNIKQVTPLGSIVGNKTNVREYLDLTLYSNEEAHNTAVSHRYLDHYKQQVVFYLVNGVYSVEFEQGCKLPDNVCGWIQHRSSVARIGAMITSGIYDPGFYCDNVGAFLHVNVPQIYVGLGERLAQFVACRSEQSELYDGQWQNT